MMSGADVRAVKDKLVALGYLAVATHDRYGTDTVAAVKRFQQDNHVAADGIVGPITWTLLFGGNVPQPQPTPVPVPTPTPPSSSLSHLGSAKVRGIAADWSTVSQTRRQICAEALRWAIDPDCPEPTMRSFYVRGADLYHKSNGAPNVMTAAKLDAYLRNPEYASYWNEGRDALMREQAQSRGYTQTGADCSGGVIGLWHFAKAVPSGFDSNADTIGAKYSVPVAAPQPGDVALRPAHVGLVVGGGYVVEWIGGAYGCQLTKIVKRMAYNYQDHRLHQFSPWTSFGKPKFY